jgi:diguanylate cyclase (GGDEF)-like protein/PAS domain S-box-containing protein
MKEKMHLNLKSFKTRLLIIFIIPSFAFLYFLYLFTQNEYSVQHQIFKYQSSTKIMVSLSKLVHALQLERGLSAGYIVSNKTILKEKLSKQCKITDNIYSKVLETSKSNYYLSDINIKNQYIISNALKLLKNIGSIRKSVLNNSITFKQEIEYYSSINNLLILSIKNINLKFLTLQNKNGTINWLLQMQEYAGIERAYTYNLLLSKNKNKELIYTIKRFVQQRKTLENNLLLSASLDLVTIYKKLYKKELDDKMDYCSKNIFDNNFYNLNPHECFETSSKYINTLNSIYQTILNLHVKRANKAYQQSIQYLYIIYIISIISTTMILIIFYLLFKLITQEENNKIDLQIAAYTFEAYSGVVVTDADGTILKVNQSFTEITGYSKNEVIGQNPRILKSEKYTNKFFEKMWTSLIKEGQWQGEITNKRKNGELYHEMLSIASIRNNNGVITHYIAQFIDISEIQEAQNVLQHQIDHDFLSGLLNRKALIQRLKESYSKAKRHNLLQAFLFIDLDNFKSVNDTYGHDIGDKLIVEVAQRMKITLREEDIVARLGGDEFAVLVTNLTEGKKEVEQIATKLLHEISKEMVLDNFSIKISSSIGIKLFPTKNTSMKNIIIHADTAMYMAKKEGKNKFVFYQN